MWIKVMDAHTMETILNLNHVETIRKVVKENVDVKWKWSINYHYNSGEFCDQYFKSKEELDREFKKLKDKIDESFR